MRNFTEVKLAVLMENVAKMGPDGDVGPSEWLQTVGLISLALPSPPEFLRKALHVQHCFDHFAFPFLFAFSCGPAYPPSLA
jgi:hypothetical protein